MSSLPNYDARGTRRVKNARANETIFVLDTGAATTGWQVLKPPDTDVDAVDTIQSMQLQRRWLMNL